jgi:hypothetical protein
MNDVGQRPLTPPARDTPDPDGDVIGSPKTLIHAKESLASIDLKLGPPTTT